MATTSSAPLVTPGVDFYTFIHKSFRNRMFEAATMAGRTDWTDSGAARATRVLLEALFFDLEEHAAHEDAFWHPLIAGVNSDALREIETEHALQGHQLAELRSLLATAAAGDAEAGAEFYRAYNVFLGGFLLHLAEEEKGNPLLWAVYREGQLEAAHAAFKLSIPMEESLRHLETMLPAMTPQERAAFLRGFEGAPPLLISAIRELAERLIGPSAFPGSAVA